MKYKLIVIFIILMACVFSSCTQPTGSISGSDGNGGVELFYVIAIKDEIYLQTEEQRRFYRRKDHLKVLGAEINDSNLKIEIITDPLAVSTAPVEVVLNVSGFFEFTQPGQYILRGTYNGKQDEYPIIVHDFDQGGGGGSTGVGIEWLP